MPIYRTTYTIVDEGDHSGNMTVYLNAADEAAALTRAEALGEIVDLIILGQITAVAIAQEVDISGWTLKAAPAADSEVDEGIEFVFRMTGLKNPTHITIPSVDLRTYSGADDTVITSNGNIANLLAELVTTGDYRDYRGGAISLFVEGYEVHGGKRTRKNR